MLGLLMLLSIPVIYIVGIKRPERAVLCWLLLTPFSEDSIEIFGFDTRILFFDRLALLASALALSANGELRNIFPQKLSRFEKAWLVYVLVFMFEAAIKFPPRDVFSLWTNTFDCYAIPFYLYLVTKYLLTRHEQYDDQFEGKLVMTLAIVALYAAPMSIFEGLTGIDLLQRPGQDTLQFSGGDIPRANGPFMNPGVLGAYLSWILLLVIYRWRVTGLEKRVSAFVRAFVRLPYLLLVVAGLYFVMFRNAWGGFLGGCGIRYLFNARSRLTLLLVGILLAVGLGVSWDAFTRTSIYKNRISNDENIYDRLGAWLYAFRAFSEHPLTGIGAAEMRHYILSAQEIGDDLRVKDIPATYHPHNTVIAQLAENGLLGVVPFVLLLCFFLGEVRACIRLARTPAEIEFGIYAASAAFAILAPGMTDRSFEWGKTNLLMYVIIGLIAAHRVKLQALRTAEVVGEAPQELFSEATSAPVR